MKVLFLYISTGGGHKKAAESICQCLYEMYPNANAYIVDALKISSKVMDKVFVSSFLKTIISRPSLYCKVYNWSEKTWNLNLLSMRINSFASKKVFNLLQDINPDVVVCTHPLTVQIMSYLRKKCGLTTPVIGVVTDYVIHPLWVYKNINAYAVPHMTMYNKLISMGIEPSNVHVTGIPISQKYKNKYDVKAIRNSLQLDNRPLFLVMGGSLGLGDVENTYKALLKLEMDIQIVVVTGHNNKLKEKLNNFFNCHKESTNKRNVLPKIYGYTDQIPELMFAADYILTKPGGLTISEALVAGKPILLTQPLPGIEERNADYLLKHDCVCQLYPDINANTLMKIVADKSYINNMLKNAQKIAKPDSCNNIVSLIHKLAKSNSYKESIPSTIPSKNTEKTVVSG